MKTSESINELAKALSAFQGEVKQPEKDAVNPHFRNKYVTLDGIVKAIQAVAPKHGLSFIQIPTTNEQGVAVSTVILHTSGQYIEFEPMTMPVERKNAQGVGSSLTYCKRYSLAAAFGIVSDEDDDGNQASAPAKQQRQQPRQSQKPPQRPQTPPKQDGGGITPEQMKTLGEAVKRVSELSGIEQPRVYENATEAAGVKGKQSKALTKEEADKVIQFLGEFS